MIRINYLNNILNNCRYGKLEKSMVKKKKNFIRIIAIVVVIIFLFLNSNNGNAALIDNSFDNNFDMQVFLPLVFANQGLLLGVYSQGSLFDQRTYDNEVKAIDEWSNKKNSIIGTFIDFSFPHPEYNILVPLDLIWENGYTPFINFMSTKSASQIANGEEDNSIIATARAFAQYARNGERFAFIAPLPEMNGDWISYGKDPLNFKKAYERIQSIFTSEGVPSASIRWVFAPNGWSEPGYEFEKFYPGDESVDIVAFSAYNFGFSTDSIWSKWETPQEVFGPYLPRIRQMAINKPIFISQTGTTAKSKFNSYDIVKKNQWLKDAYIYLSEQEQVRAIIYFNLVNNQKIDWPFYPHGISEFYGYKEGVNNGNYIYVAPKDIFKFK